MLCNLFHIYILREVLSLPDDWIFLEQLDRVIRDTG